VIESDTCIEPIGDAPCVEEQDVRVKARPPANWGLTDQQLREAEEIGEIYSVLEITPDDRVWDPGITVVFILKQPAPSDLFTLTILQWFENIEDWDDAGEATAESRGDTEAIGEITHTSLFALVDAQAKPVPTTSVTEPPVVETVEVVMPVVAEFTAELPDDTAFFIDDGRIRGGCGITVQFVNQSNGAEEFFWDFGDGESSNDREPVHGYSAPSEGTTLLTVTLVAVGPGGTDEARRVDYIEHQCIR
jgi:hypothetical protein